MILILIFDFWILIIMTRILLFFLLIWFIEVNSSSLLRSGRSNSPTHEERQLALSYQQHNHNHNHHHLLPVCSLYEISFKGIWKQTNPFFGKFSSSESNLSLITGNSRYRPGGKDFICCGWDTNDYLDGEIVGECGKKAVDQLHYTGDPTHLGKVLPCY